jgi:hypothetical protein
MNFFIPSNIFLEVVKLHVFRKKILGTLRDITGHAHGNPH